MKVPLSRDGLLPLAPGRVAHIDAVQKCLCVTWLCVHRRSGRQPPHGLLRLLSRQPGEASEGEGHGELLAVCRQSRGPPSSRPSPFGGSPSVMVGEPGGAFPQRWELHPIGNAPFPLRGDGAPACCPQRLTVSHPEVSHVRSRDIPCTSLRARAWPSPDASHSGLAHLPAGEP